MKLGLVLGSGGAKGIAHIAFLKELDEMGIRPSVIAGTSMGALLGALYGSGVSAEEMETCIKSMGLKQMRDFIDIDLSRNSGGLVKGDKVMKFYEGLAKKKNFSSLRMPLKIIATDLWRQEEVVFSKGNVADAVRASISIPGIFNPVILQNRTLVDGGLVNPLPCGHAKRHCDVLMAINVLGRDTKQRSAKPNIFESISISLDIMQKAITQNRLENYKPDIYLAPHLGKVNMLQFYKAKEILKNMEPMAATLRKQLEKLDL